MQINVFSVYDSKAEFYGTPFFMPTVNSAIRAFSDLANDRSTTIFKHPGDFTLFHIGTFDDRQGIVSPLKVLVNLGLALNFVSSPVVTSPQRFNGAVAEILNPEVK